MAGYEPEYVLLHFKRARLLEGLGRKEESLSEMRKAVALDPPLVFQQAEYQRARQLAEEKRWRDALVVYQKLLLDYPDCVPVLVDDANCRVMLRDFPEAVADYQRALSLDPGNEAARHNLEGITLGKPVSILDKSP